MKFCFLIYFWTIFEIQFFDLQKYMHCKHNLLFNLTGFISLFFQLMWIGMQEILWRLPRSFNFILLVCNVRISQQKLKSLERYGDSSELMFFFRTFWYCHLNFCCMYALSKQEIALMEDELNKKNELIKKQENLIQEWKKELKDQLDKHTLELDRV